MTKDEFRQALKRNGVTCDEFAEITGISVRTVYRYGCESNVPRSAKLFLRLFDERGGVTGLIGVKNMTH